MYLSRDREMLARDYERALRSGDLEGQYEILRYVQRYPDMLNVIEDVEAAVMPQETGAEIQWSTIRADLATGARVERLLVSWERSVRRLEPFLRLGVSAWPPVAAVIIALITYTLVTRPVTLSAVRVLLLLAFVVIGSVFVLCASNMWNPVWNVRWMRAGATSLSRRTIRLVAASAGLGLVGGAACAVLLLALWMGPRDVIYATTIVKRTGYFSATGVAELPLRLVERTPDSKYVLSVSREGSKGPISVSVYDSHGKLVARDTGEAGRALVDLRPQDDKSYRVRLEAWGAPNPTAVRWQTKVLEFDASDVARIGFGARRSSMVIESSESSK